MHQKPERVLRSPLSNQVPLVIQGSKAFPFSLSILHKISETVIIVGWMRDIFEFDQPYKQAESKIK